MYRDSTAEKIEKIQFLLAAGNTRPQVAKLLGYTDVSCLYRYASSHNLKWNPEKKNYDAIGNNGKPIEAVKPIADNPTGKEANVISMLGRGIDGREIAKRLRFATYQAMADYMKNRGYVWSEFKNNYVKEPKEVRQQAKVEEPKTEAKSDISSFGKYDEMLKMMFENIEKLKELLNINNQGAMPRYLINGVVIPKTISITNTIDKLVKEYCEENNITQREFFEVAAIDFLKNYGYKDVVKANLKV